MVQFLNMPQYQPSPLLDLSPLAQGLQMRQKAQQAEAQRAMQERKMTEQQRQFDLGNARGDKQLALQEAQARRDAAMDPLRQKQLDTSIKMLERQLNAPVDDGSKVMEVNNQIFRVPKQGQAQLIGGSDPVAQAQQVSAARRAQVVAAGIDPESATAKAFVASGKMPREDQQPLTATDKKAILEADQAVMTGQGVIDNLNEAVELSKKAYTGPTAGVRGYVGSLVGSEGGVETENLNNLITTNALQQLKALFGAAPTEGERKILLDIQGSVSKAPAVREEIYKRAAKIAGMRLELAKRQADQIRGNTYYKPQGGPSNPNQPNGWSARKID
jgi:hypothetical protein